MNINNLKCLPDEIKNERRWVLYGKNFKTGSDKCPYIYDKKSNKVFALSTNEKYFSLDNFYNLDNTINIYNAVMNNKIDVYNGEIYGIGYYFYNSKYSVIDIDKAFYDDTNNIRYSFKKLIDSCIDKTFIEYSKSKRGLHILVENDVNISKWEFKLKYLKKAYEKSGIDIDKEIYSQYGEPGIDYLCDKKFVALTGELYNNITDINYKTSEFERIYNSFKKYYKNDDIKKRDPVVRPEVKKYKSGSKNIDGRLYVDDYYSYIKSKLTLFDVVARYSNVNLLNGKLHYCPLHSNHNNKSFMLSNKDNNRYICFSSNCVAGKYIDNGITGDLFDFTKHINNLSGMRQVAEKLNNDFNLGLIFNWEFKKAN